MSIDVDAALYCAPVPDIPRRRPRTNAPGRGGDTRARIAAAALALFNARGSHAVSTRHVATRLGISPGNLYYHFGNKEEIVLHLYAGLEADIAAILEPGAAGGRSFDEVLAYLDAIFAHLWAYRFFYRESNALLRDVPGLAPRYRALASGTIARTRALFADMVERGWMEASEGDLDLLAANAWIVLTQWFAHLQVLDGRRTLRAADVHAGIRHLVALVRPLLRAPQRRRVEHLLGPPARAPRGRN